ncbi:hypothetical protein KKI22_00395 [Patescibacteria group bacterium]|nr:hypothetical protein [Patescibacteria group bacterium]
MTKENKLSTFFTWFLIGSVFLLPIFFCPFIINPLINSKLLLVFLIAFVSVFVFIAQSIQKKSWEIIKTPFTLPLFAFALLVIISSLVSHQYPSKQLLGMGGAYLAFASIIMLAPSILKDKFSKYFIVASNIAALVLSVLSIAQALGFGLSSLINRTGILELPDSLAFSLSGSTFVAIQFLSAVLLSNVFDQKSWQKSLFNKITTVFIAIALGVNVLAILPKGEASFQSLSLANSVSVARGSLTFTRNALFGYGPDSYGNAYNILKPLSVNGLDYWQFTFDSAFNLPLTILVSVGSIAFLAYAIFLVKTVIVVKKKTEEEVFLKTFILTALVWQFLAPVNLVMLFLLALALAFFINAYRDKYKKISFSVHSLTDLLHRGKWTKTKNLAFIGGNVAISLFAIFALYVIAKNFFAYHLLYKSSVSISKNQVADAYDYHKKAKLLAPQVAFIRRSYSLLNLQIAIALSNKADISPAEQEQVLQLVNQAIGEAKAATVLDPSNYQNWSVLSQIYMQLLDTTSQAQQEAFNSLAKAATYNPGNPEIRIILGQLFFNVKKYSEATTFFNQAIERKPDMFLAHYYLAQTLIANKQLAEAKTSLVNSLNLLDKGTDEYEAVEDELNALIEQIENNAKAAEPMDQIPGSVIPDLSEASSKLSTLDKEDAEAAIQESALTPDQSLVEN